MDTVKILDRKFVPIGIAGNFTCLKYIREFRGAGDAVLTLPIGRAAGLLMPDGYIKVPDGTLYRIVSVETDLKGGTVTARCTGLLSFFEGTVFSQEYAFEGEAAAMMYSLAGRGMENMPKPYTAGDAMSSKKVAFASGRSRLYDDLVSLCYLGDLGMKMDYDGERLVFSVVTPTDRTQDSDDPYSVSRRLGTFEPEGILWDFGSYFNKAVVSGPERETGGRYTAMVRAEEIDLSGSFPDPDFYSRQMQVNFTVPLGLYKYEDENGDNVLDEEAYTVAMIAAGAAALGRCRPKLQLYGKSSSAVSELSAGDTVTLSDADSGLTGTAVAERIVTEYTDGVRMVTAELSAALSPEIME